METINKEEWKNSLFKLLTSEPGVSNDANSYLTRKLFDEYISELEDKSDAYYGISHEIIVALELYLNK